MAELGGLIKFTNSEYRPCFVKGKKALFHRWEEIKEIAMIKMGQTCNRYEKTVAIIEYEDGSVHECYPDEIKFCDNKIMEYAFTEEGAK